jgi:general secretion pathway protein L
MAILQLYVPEEGVSLDSTHTFAYGLRSNGGELQRSGTGSLTELPRADRLELILPAGLVLLTEVKLPPVRGQKLRQMLPFAVEDQILSDPESVHVAAGARAADGATPVAVIDKAWLKDVLEALRRAKLRADRAIPETCLPELEPQAWTLVWNGRDGFVRTGPALGMALDSVDETLSPLALARAVTEAKVQNRAPQRIIFRATDDARSIPNFASWGTTLGAVVVPGKDWEWAPRFLNTADAINFLQGEFAPSSGIRDLVPELKPIWLLAGLVIALQGAATTYDWWRLTREQRALQTDMEKTFRAAFPDAKIVDAPLQMQRNLADLRRASGAAEPNDFLPLAAKAANLFGPGVKMQAFHYDNGALKADVLLADQNAAEELRSRLTGDKARIEATTPKDGGVSARVAIGGGP